MDPLTKKLLAELHATLCSMPYSGTITMKHTGSILLNEDGNINVALQNDVDNLKAIKQQIIEACAKANKSESEMLELQRDIVGIRRIFGFLK